jgi:mono/diheme cytochrome c family protein
MWMLRILSRPTLALIVLLGGLAAAAGVRAQEKPKTDDPGKESKKPAGVLKAEENYKTVCQVCHLADGKGLIPDMSFTDGVWKNGSTTDDVIKVITNGSPSNPLMLPFKDKFTKDEIAELAKIVRAFDPKLKDKK